MDNFDPLSQLFETIECDSRFKVYVVTYDLRGLNRNKEYPVIRSAIATISHSSKKMSESCFYVCANFSTAADVIVAIEAEFARQGAGRNASFKRSDIITASEIVRTNHKVETY